jgi:sulfoxide reductase heme-binding subunit YedZ
MVLLDWVKARWLRIAAHAGAVVPLAWLLWAYWQGLFLVDPVREITTLSGKTALILLLLSLACAPINTVLGYRRVLRLRRPLGMYAALYVGLHFLTFVWLDYGLDLGLLGAAIFDQRYVLVGFAAGLLLLPLVLTSTRAWQRRLGKNWKRLHRLGYLAGILAIVHFVWLEKDFREPLRYGVLLGVLLFVRVPWIRRALSRTRGWLRTRWERHAPGAV